MQALVNGLISGLGISLLSLAFAVVYLPTRVFYIALGAIYASAPFIALASARLALPWYVSVGAAVLFGAGVSACFEIANHSRLERRQGASGLHLVSSLGIYILVVQILALGWGNETQSLRFGADTAIRLGAVILTRTQLIAAVASIVVLLTFSLWLRATDVGLRFRGLAVNAKELSLRGHNVRLLRLIAFGMAGGLASVSALLNAYDLGFDPHSGLAALVLAVVGFIIGGRQSFLGPILGGVLVGLLRAEVVWFLSSHWQEGITFLLLAIFLLVRPNGLFARKTRLEAQS